jgi:hypothetical protein
MDNSSDTGMSSASGVACIQSVTSRPGPRPNQQTRARAAWTERARKHACRRVGRDGHPVGAVAHDFGVGWVAVVAPSSSTAPGWSSIPNGSAVSAVGVDESAFARAKPFDGVRHRCGGSAARQSHRRHRGGSRKALADWLSEQPADWTAGIEHAALDPFRGSDQPCRPACRTPYRCLMRSIGRASQLAEAHW